MHMIIRQFRNYIFLNIVQTDVVQFQIARTQPIHNYKPSVYLLPSSKKLRIEVHFVC